MSSETGLAEFIIVFWTHCANNTDCVYCLTSRLDLQWLLRLGLFSGFGGDFVDLGTGWFVFAYQRAQVSILEQNPPMWMLCNQKLFVLCPFHHHMMKTRLESRVVSHGSGHSNSTKSTAGVSQSLLSAQGAVGNTKMHYHGVCSCTLPLPDVFHFISFVDVAEISLKT